jgi:hypothetical protein
LPARRSRRFCRLLLEKIEAWLEPMLSSLDPEGLPGTWFARSRGGPTLDAEAPGWLGGSCVAVRLALLRALLAWDAVRFAGLAVTLAEAVQRAWEGDASHGAFFYGEAWTAELLLSTRHASLARAQEACTTEILARQQPDGSFGTPLETALMLRALASRLEALDRRRALRALCEARLPDGSWPEEPIYRMPGVSQGFGERWLRSRSMVTALCATAVQTTFEAETSEAFRRATG